MKWMLAHAGAVMGAVLGFAQQSGHVLEYPAPLVREQQTVIVSGRPEVWRLEWAAEPKHFCEAAATDAWFTCSCLGFAFGETGDLFMSRSRDGVEVDRLHLTPLFESGETGVAVLQRWKPDLDKDLQPGFKSAENLPALAARRPTVQIMHFADYDHDGQASEFYLQTDTQPCFHTYGIVVGVSRRNPRLHAFGSVSHPDRPLVMDATAWRALREARGPTEVNVIGCGDHGAGTETAFHLRWSADGIDGTRREYSCPEAGGERRLLEETPLSQR